MKALEFLTLLCNLLLHTQWRNARLQFPLNVYKFWGTFEKENSGSGQHFFHVCWKPYKKWQRDADTRSTVLDWRILQPAIPVQRSNQPSHRVQPLSTNHGASRADGNFQRKSIHIPRTQQGGLYIVAFFVSAPGWVWECVWICVWRFHLQKAHLLLVLSKRCPRYVFIYACLYRHQSTMYTICAWIRDWRTHVTASIQVSHANNKHELIISYFI
jgi:hypothetical protein